jgi:uncharacterized membrane protein SpoIIM required for sporulation
LSSSEANDLRNEFSFFINGIDQTGIFVHNAKLALSEFVPLLGIGLGIYYDLSTGVIIGVLEPDLNANVNGILPLLLFIITPFGLMELFAYGIAISRSGMLFHSLLKRKHWREYLLPTLIEIGVVLVLLSIGAVIEYEMIQPYL